MPTTTTTAAALSLEGLTKTFEGQRALDSIDFELREGEIHALLGQNGSGKSTLVKLLAGYHQPTAVTRAELHGTTFDLGSASAAQAGHVRFIHQDLGLVATLDGIDNLALGAPYSRRWWLSDRRERRAATELCERYGLDIDVTAPVGTLTPAQQTMLAVVRALRGGAESRMVLVLDEPTAALPDHEVDRLFELLRTVRQTGASLIYVTHRLAEVFELTDRVTVLRDGRSVGTHATSDLDADGLLQLIIGRSLDAQYPASHAPEGEVALGVSDIRGGRVREVSIDIGRGEVVGVTGLLGSGYEDLLGLIFDASRRASGVVTLNGHRVPIGGPEASVRSGIGYAPADRKRLGGMLEWTVRENLTLPAPEGNGPARWLGVQAERVDAAKWLRQLQVTPADPDRLFSSLSGGNQQKVVLARWLRCGVAAYLLDEPTNGVDVGAKHAIYEALAAATSAGAAVLLSSSDAEELCAFCDRVVVMRRGRISSILRGADLTVDVLRAECARDDEWVASGASEVLVDGRR